MIMFVRTQRCYFPLSNETCPIFDSDKNTILSVNFTGKFCNYLITLLFKTIWCNSFMSDYYATDVNAEEGIDDVTTSTTLHAASSLVKHDHAVSPIYYSKPIGFVLRLISYVLSAKT